MLKIISLDDDEGEYHSSIWFYDC